MIIIISTDCATVLVANYLLIDEDRNGDSVFM